MHHVILDTNIYRNDPSRKKLDFQAFEKLAKFNLSLVIILIWVVTNLVSMMI
ncbi:hypothetical protein DFP76_105136 [Marinomonas aquiplantarum]|uniref:Uncharacterized protein n=1 Tax=Marinomonas aquiplantarum TaxID=491951 RepID=A0A366CXV0_9GAMM|nr:hypothetical protein DFP76_105136 [Marinomonas aquiplantarum]